jgi:hypothetical protein
VYTVISGPTQGTLNLGASFTQLAIDNDLLRYTHTGAGKDSFTFSLSDGKTTIGPFVFDITFDPAPKLDINAELAVSGSDPQAIDNTLLSATDPTDSASTLTYIVSKTPTHGTLSLEAPFTQADIDNHLLTYTPNSSGSDSFTFTLTDGKNIAGPFTFHISNP